MNKDKNFKILTVFGILWNWLSQFTIQIFQFIVLIILARLLSPQDFGIVGIATVVTGLITIINELGLSAAIIQRKNVSQLHLSTSFWANFMMSTILFIFVVSISSFVADFFQVDMVRPILILSSTGLIIGSLGIVHRALLEKNIDFKKITIVEVSATLVSGIISIFLAINGYGAWSIVLGSISNTIVSVLLLWKIVAWKPSLQFNFLHFKELFAFGGNIVGGNFLRYIAMNIDYLIVGKFFGTFSLGYYTLARNLTSFPVQNISWTIMRVAFPAFSKIQDDDENLRNGYLRVVKYVSLMTFPMLAGLFSVAPEFVSIFYGEKWIPMIILIQIFCVNSAFISIGTLANTIQYSKGRSDLPFKQHIYGIILMPIAVIIGTKYGIVGMSIAVTAGTIFLVLIFQMVTNKLISLNMRSIIKIIIPAATSSIIVMTGIALYRYITVYNIQQIYIFLSSVLIGILLYILSIRILYNYILDEIKTLIREVRG